MNDLQNCLEWVIIVLVWRSVHCKWKTPVISRYTRNTSECTGRLPEFQECTGGLLDFFTLLKLQFFITLSFDTKKASECTGGIPVVHDWNILNHESLHQRYYVGPSREVLLEKRFSWSNQQICCGRRYVQYLVTSVNRIHMLAIKPSLLHTTFQFQPDTAFHYNHQNRLASGVFRRYSIIRRQHGAYEANCSQVYWW